MPRKVSWIRSVLMMSVIYVIVSPASGIKVASALPFSILLLLRNSASRNPPDVHNLTNVNNVSCVSTPEDIENRELYDYIFAIAVFIPFVSMFAVHCSFQTIDLKYMSVWNAFVHLMSFVTYFVMIFPSLLKWELWEYMNYTATFFNFFLLCTTSWSSILSSDFCILKACAALYDKKGDQSFLVTKKMSYLKTSALIAVPFLCISMGVVYFIDAMNDYAVILTVPVLLMAIFNSALFCKRVQLHEVRKQFPLFDDCVDYVRKTNNLFFCISVFQYIMWGFNVLVSLLDNPWLWVLFDAIFLYETLVVVIASEPQRRKQEKNLKRLLKESLKDAFIELYDIFKKDEIRCSEQDGMHDFFKKRS